MTDTKRERIAKNLLGLFRDIWCDRESDDEPFFNCSKCEFETESGECLVKWFIHEVMKIEIDQKDFGTLCICAIRYCHGRKTYMPSLVREIVGRHLSELSDRDIEVMYDDCRFMNPSDYGDEIIDKPNWLKWERDVKDEIKRREDGE